LGPNLGYIRSSAAEQVNPEFPRRAQLIAPLNLLNKDLPGDSDTRQLPIFVNDDIILYTRKPVRLADEYIERAKRAEQPIS
jgi:hypothetical protein